jgi:hypothetical protein
LTMIPDSSAISRSAPVGGRLPEINTCTGKLPETAVGPTDQQDPINVVTHDDERAGCQGVRLWGARIVVILLAWHGRRLSAAPAATVNALHPLFAYSR